MICANSQLSKLLSTWITLFIHIQIICEYATINVAIVKNMRYTKHVVHNKQTSKGKHKMNKSQAKQVDMINVYLANGMQDTAARSLSSLIRSAMTSKSKFELVQIAKMHNLLAHPDFKCGFQIIN